MNDVPLRTSTLYTQTHAYTETHAHTHTLTHAYTETHARTPHTHTHVAYNMRSNPALSVLFAACK